MRRDGNTRNEAVDRINEVNEMMEDCGYDPEESETIFMEQLGLGPNYLIDMFLEILKRKWFDE